MSRFVYFLGWWMVLLSIILFFEFKPIWALWLGFVGRNWADVMWGVRGKD